MMGARGATGKGPRTLHFFFAVLLACFAVLLASLLVLLFCLLTCFLACLLAASVA